MRNIIVNPFFTRAFLSGMIAFLAISNGCDQSECLEVTQEPSLGAYYTNYEERTGAFDENGIPLSDYGGDIGLQYNPVAISQHALGCYSTYLETGNCKSANSFLKQADWLREHLVPVREGNVYVWEYSFDFKKYQLEAPWISAMAQGQGISVLLRAYGLTGDVRYLEAAQAALISFETPITDGGISYEDEDGFIWYEEYPALPPPHVLNGFIYALFGLYDMYEATDSERAKNLFDQGVDTLAANMNLYDNGYWSEYDLAPKEDNNYTLRFKADTSHPRSDHPVDEIALIEMIDDSQKILVTIDVGYNDNSLAEGYIYWNPGYMDWGERYELDGRTVRNYENVGGKWEHAPFNLEFDIDINSTYMLSIKYKDVSTEPIYVELYIPSARKYFRLGSLDTTGSGEWKMYSIDIPKRLLFSANAASLSYHRVHIEQLLQMYALTDESVFYKYAEKFQDYLDTFNSIIDG